MNIIKKSAYVLAIAVKGNPVHAILAVMLFYVFFNVLEMVLEKLIYGQSFVHWLDPIFLLLFIVYAGLCVYMCAAVKD